jgi:predicted transcriptional regulator
MVNAHGCSMRSPIKLEAGVPLHFHNPDGRETTAQVVYCQPLGSDRNSWTLGARFDQPDNFWGLKTAPQDWARLPVPAAEKLAPKLVPDNRQATLPDQAAASVKIALERIRKQLSDEHLKIVLAELVRPLEAEVTELKDKLAQGARRSRFEVSLSQIPPELEQQLELRLKKELGPQVLKQAREQSEQVLETAKAAIAQKTTETHDHFLGRVTRELESVEQRTQGLSNEFAQNLREHLNRGLGELHQEVADAGNRLKRLSEDLLHVMEHSLGEEHDARRRQLEQVEAAVASESSRLREQITDLDRRMATLDESASRLESGLDKRLSQMASDTVRTARGQMESALEAALNELGTRNTQELGNQLDEASANLKIIQKGIEASLSESLKLQAAQTLQSFDHSMEELALQSMERWRSAFAGGLNSLVRILGEQFITHAATDGNASQLRSNGKPGNGARK